MVAERLEPPSGPSDLDIPLEQIFPRIHARALGIALGVTAGGGLFLLTAFHILSDLPPGLPLGLLRQYFYGYSVKWPGALAGLVWGAATGFVAGWLLAVVHNLTLHLWLLVVRERTDLSQKRNLVDYLRTKG